MYVNKTQRYKRSDDDLKAAENLPLFHIFFYFTSETKVPSFARCISQLKARQHSYRVYLGLLLGCMTGDRLCGLVVRVLGYRSGGPGSIPGTTRFSGKKKNK
jgi:hypothetical protein